MDTNPDFGNIGTFAVLPHTRSDKDVVSRMGYIKKGIIVKEILVPKHSSKLGVNNVFLCLKACIFINVLKFLVLYDIKLYYYTLCVFFCQLVSTYYLRFLNSVSSIFSWNHCKYMIYYIIFI